MVEKWNLMNPQGNEWNALHLKITKITLQAKDTLRFPSNFVCGVYTLCLFGMNASFQTRLCVCVQFQKVGRGCSPLLKAVRGAVELVWHSFLFIFFKSQTL